MNDLSAYRRKMLGMIYELCELLPESEQLDLTAKVQAIGKDEFRRWTLDQLDEHLALACATPAKRQLLLQKFPDQRSIHVLAAAQILAWGRQLLVEIEGLDRPQGYREMVRTAVEIRVELLSYPDALWPVSRVEAPFEDMVDLSS